MNSFGKKHSSGKNTFEGNIWKADKCDEHASAYGAHPTDLKNRVQLHINEFCAVPVCSYRPPIRVACVGRC